MRNALAISCALIGGFIGNLGFVLLMRRGFYALVLPGGLPGLSAGIVRTRSITVAILSALLAIIAGLLTEYQFAPFVVDGSLGYFLRHLTELRPVTVTLIGLGGLIGFWVPFRRRSREI